MSIVFVALVFAAVASVLAAVAPFFAVVAPLFVVVVAPLVIGVPAMGWFPGGGVRDSCLLAEKPVFVAGRGLALPALAAISASGAVVGMGFLSIIAGVRARRAG